MFYDACDSREPRMGSQLTRRRLLRRIPLHRLHHSSAVSFFLILAGFALNQGLLKVSVADRNRKRGACRFQGSKH